MASPPICSGSVDVAIAPTAPGWPPAPVHIQPHRRSIIRRRQVRPPVGGQRRRPVGGCRMCHPSPGDLIVRRTLQIVTVVSLVDHVPPPISPSTDTPMLPASSPSSDPTNRRIVYRHPRTRPVERQRIPILARRRPRRRPDRPVVPVARCVRHRRPRPFVKSIRRHQARRLRIDRQHETCCWPSATRRSPSP